MSDEDTSQQFLEILQCLEPAWVHENIVQRHIEARESYSVGTAITENPAAFQFEICAYVQHHRRFTNREQLAPEFAAATARAVLDQFHPRGSYTSGSTAALATALGREVGGLVAVVNNLAYGLGATAVTEHVQTVTLRCIRLGNRGHAGALATAIEERLAKRLRTFGRSFERFAFETDVLRSLSSIQQEVRKLYDLMGGPQ